MIDTPDMTFAERFSMVRKRRGFTQRTLSEKSGVGQSAIACWENSQTANPSALCLYWCACVLNVSMEYLLTGKERK